MCWRRRRWSTASRKDMRIRVDGTLPRGTTAKDLVLTIIGRIGAQGARGYVVEYCGSAIEALSIEARFTLCNMTVEAGARGALIAPDADGDRLRAGACARTSPATPRGRRSRTGSDAAQRRRRRASTSSTASTPSDVAPQVTWGTSPDQVIAIDGRVPCSRTCRTARSAAAPNRRCATRGCRPARRSRARRCSTSSSARAPTRASRTCAPPPTSCAGRHVAAGVRAMVVPGSGAVKAAAEAEGLDRLFTDAGFEWRQPGCSMCLAMNDDVLADGVRCASTTNRNFEGRQGRGAITHLMSPAMAAAAAVTGRITDVRQLETLQ